MQFLPCGSNPFLKKTKLDAVNPKQTSFLLLCADYLNIDRKTFPAGRRRNIVFRVDTLDLQMVEIK